MNYIILNNERGIIRMITRRILITTTKDKEGGEHHYYGRYDAVALAARGETIAKTEFKQYKVKEEDFIRIAKEI